MDHILSDVEINILVIIKAMGMRSHEGPQKKGHDEYDRDLLL
jgi:hypothetical protein